MVGMVVTTVGGGGHSHWAVEKDGEGQRRGETESVTEQ